MKEVFGSISEIIPKLPNDGLVVDAFEKCLTAVQALRDDAAKWEVTWATPLGYTDGWSDNLWPPHNGFVFNYCYTLPRLAHAIFMFLAAIAALEPSALTRYRSELARAIDKLQSVHDMIASSVSPRFPPNASDSLVGSKIPALLDVAYVGEAGAVLAAWRTAWFDGNPASGEIVVTDPRVWP